MTQVSNSNSSTPMISPLLMVHPQAIEKSKPSPTLSIMERTGIGILGAIFEVSVNQGLVGLKLKKQNSNPTTNNPTAKKTNKTRIYSKLYKNAKALKVRFINFKINRNLFYNFKIAEVLKRETFWNCIRQAPEQVKYMYAGGLANMTGLAVVLVPQIVVNGKTNDYFLVVNQGAPLTFGQKIASAAAAGFISTPFSCTSELIMDRHRSALNSWRDKKTKGETNEIKPAYWSTIRILYKNEGFGAATLGFSYTAVRESGFSVAYLVGASYFKEKYRPYIKNEVANAIVSGCTAGLIGGVLTHPFDTWKTDVQNNRTVKVWHGSIQSSIESAFRGIWARTARIGSAVTILSETSRWATDKILASKV